MAQHVPDAQHELTALQESLQKQSPPASQEQPDASQAQSLHAHTSQQLQGEADVASGDRKAAYAIGAASNKANIEIVNVFMEITPKLDSETENEHCKSLVPNQE